MSIHRLPSCLRMSALSLALLAAMPCDAQSLRIDYQVGLSLLHSDNINLSQTAPDSETVLSPELVFEARKSGSDVQFDARGRLQYLDYQDSTYSDEARGELAARLNWIILPQRLSFVVEDYLGQQPIDVLGGFTPNNRQQINVFTTGPSVFVRFNDAMRAQFDLRYTDTYAEESREFNGHRYNGAGRLFRELDPSQSLSFNVEATRARYDNVTTDASYWRYDAYAGYRRESARIDLDVALGYTSLEQDGTAGNASEPLARARLDWRIAPRSTITALADYQFADAASDLIADSALLDSPLINDLSASTTLVGPQVFRQRRYELGYQFDGERLDVMVRPYLDRIEYRDTTLVSSESRGAYLVLDYRLRPRQSLSFLAAGERREFTDASRRDDDLSTSLRLVHRFTEQLSGSIGWQRKERDSSATGQSYTENVATIGIQYSR